MTATTTTLAQTTAVAGAILVAGVAAFQVALALGAPLGDAVFGGRAPTVAGVLTGPFRSLAGVQALVLLAMGWLLLSRVGLATMPFLGSGTLPWVTWVVVAFLALNTLGNLAAPHPVERWVMGSITLVLTVLGVVIALRGPDLT